MKILVAVDGSSFTKRMLAYLAAHDEWLVRGNSFTVVNAVSPVPPRASAVLDKALLKGYYDDEAEKVFKPIRAFFKRQSIEATYVSKVGSAAEVIAATADKGDFDLLVMGSHGHSSLGNLVMGSVATKVMAHCKTPVLLVR
ncbi:universal stress protein [Ideonella sp. 4Y11]|uniref:Universal stress protein n=1 Tax=Ideonella aquatica TaxID=2824119 RepID=A0A941BLK0_9BURK|nr:universal stress protein [Ideonella aquatica]MBQ0959774.1 universal stress protein [Ideonella aquatica]